MMEIGKAVIPAAGWGTRFLPATKVTPKEMLPLLDKPMIQYIVEEAVACGLDHIIIITSSQKKSIEDHFDRFFDLENVLKQKREDGLLSEVRRVADLAHICYIRQKEQLGLGHAILTAKEVIGDEAFAVLLPDDIFDARPPVIKQMLDVYHRYQRSVIALWPVTAEDTKRYGIIKPNKVEERVYQILDMVEKPGPDKAPSNLAILGRYILTPEIFAALSETPPGKGREIQLTDGLKLLLQQQAIYGYEFEGTYYDTGIPLGWLKASVVFALKHPEMGAEFREYLKGLIADL